MSALNLGALGDLPVEVLGLVFDFARVRTQNEKHNPRSLSQPHMSLTATNKHFYDVRRHLYLRLNRKYSLKYYQDEEFRAHVHSRLENPSKQLSLNLSKCNNITDVSALGGVHTLDLSGCWNITDVSALGGVHTLNLSRCWKIADVSALGGVHTLDLSECSNITDVSALGGVHTLNLSDCHNITDVSALGGVHTLTLSGCSKIADVSALGGVHTLIR